MMMKWVVFLAFALGIYARKLPSYIQKCKAADPSINQCITDQSNELLPKLTQGAPDLFIPSYDPLLISNLSVVLGSGNARFFINWDDIHVFGIPDMRVKNLNLDLKSQRQYLELECPRMSFETKYTMEGKISILELNGSGKNTLSITDVFVMTDRNLDLVDKNGKQYMKFHHSDKSKLTYKLEDIRFDDLVKGNPALTDQMNMVIKDNYDELRQKIDPIIIEAIDALATEIVQQFLDHFSLDDLFD